LYTINHNTETNILEVKNTENTVFGKIHLNEGASLQELTLGGNAIIQDLAPLTYDSTFASSILFPFANRIKDGKYSFNGEDFQLEKNQEEEQNALHGFVYNKTFKVIAKEASADNAKITVEYNENIRNDGFPYTYTIVVTYIFTNDGLDTTGSETVNSMIHLDIEKKQLDDCWGLNSDKVAFNTPKYQLNFQSSGTNNYLQAYTPPRLNTIAIEPTTGVSNSFNNKIGLQTLDPNEKYSIVWKINIINN